MSTTMAEPARTEDKAPAITSISSEGHRPSDGSSKVSIAHVRIAVSTDAYTDAFAAISHGSAGTSAARTGIDRLGQLCAEVYQVAGTLGADASVLDNLWAAADGKPFPHASLLPYSTKTKTTA
jgi:hypothetical protein